MRPLSLSLSGFGSYQEPQTVDFEGVRLACITGHNGAGKTALFESIGWALFGYVPNGDIDAIVNDGSDRAEVAFTFDHAGERYRVTRTRVRGKKTSARIERLVDDEFVTFEAGGVRAVDNEVEKLIRISPETFVATVLMAQEDSGRFARATPAERKQILSEILGLDQYQELAKAARDRAREARQLHDGVQGQIDEIDGKLAGADADTTALIGAQGRLADLGPAIAEARSNLDTATAALSRNTAARERLSVIEPRIADGAALLAKRGAELQRSKDQTAARVTRAAAALNEARGRAARIEAAEFSLGALEEAVAEASGQLTALEQQEQAIITSGQEAKGAIDAESAEINRLTSAVEEARERLRTLGHDSAECFTCGQSLPGDLRHQLTEKVEHEVEVLTTSIGAATSRRTDAEGRRSKLRDELAGCRKAKDEAKALHATSSNKLVAATTLIATKAAVAGDTARSEEDHTTAVSDAAAAEAAYAAGPDDGGLAALRAEAEELRKAIASEEALEGARAQAQLALNALEAEQAPLHQTIGTLSERIAGYEALRSAREEALASAKSAARDAEEWTVLVRAFGQDGVPNLVFAGAAQELERDAADLMNKLSNGRYRLEMRTEKVNKVDGETIGALDVVVMADSGKMRPFARLSGGEKFRVTLVLHTSLTRFLVRRSGAPIEFLGVDEGWGALDPEGIVAMLDALRMLHDEFSLILTITHTPEVAAAFECCYQVEKDSDGTSVVTLVAA